MEYNGVMMSSVDFDKYFASADGYKGCMFASNFKYSMLKTPLDFAILNLDDRKGGMGTHWVAFAYIGGKEYMYYDSFGFPPDDSLLSKTKTILWNPNKQQDDDSVNCGLLCLLFIKNVIISSAGNARNRFMSWCFGKHGGVR